MVTGVRESPETAFKDQKVGARGRVGVGVGGRMDGGRGWHSLQPQL